LVDADPRDVLPLDLSPEGQMGEDRQFLRRVAAVDIHGRVGFGKSQSLRFLYRLA
jgi:hypothetical protein